LRDLLEKAVDHGRGLGAEFVDIRVERVERTSLTIQEGVLKEVRSGYEEGAAIRVLYRGAWGFVSVNRVSWEELRRGVEEAFSAARALSTRVRRRARVVELPALSDRVVHKFRRDPRDVGLDEKIGDVTTYESLLRSRGFVRSTSVTYADIVGEKVYASSDGRYVEQGFGYAWLYTWVTGREGAVVASARDERGSIEGYVIWDRWSPEDIAKLVLGRLEKQLRAKTPRGGVFPAVLAPEVVGVFVHEAFGHLAEADLTLSGSAISDKLGKRVASRVVTIVDDPTIPGGFGTYRYDDEGVEARPAVLIERGVVKELMVDREHAAFLGQRPTGNARAESYRVPPLIRMRNTVLKPSDHSVEELFEGIRYGYYLVSFRGGQANLDGTFQVGVQEAYEIVNGEVRDPVRNMSISGNTLDTLKEVDAVAKDFEIGYGRCGKGQTVFVSDGGPHVRVRKIVVGGAR